ncbi:1,4-dihydroxy-2-naphthoyl-CoA synthase [Castellaniella defragrans]
MQKGSESRNVDTESADRNVGVGSVRVDIESAIATVTIERGDSLNALNDEVLTGIVNAMREVERMESIRVVVLRGAGRRAFASGMDLHVLGSYDPPEPSSILIVSTSRCAQSSRCLFPSLPWYMGMPLGAELNWRLHAI